MQIRKKIKRIFEPRLKLLPGTRLTSFLFIAASIALAFGILFAANIYYNIDTGEIVSEQTMNITGQSKELKFTVGDYYIAFRAPTLSTTSVYTLPTSTAPAANYMLASYDTSGTLYWMSPAAAGLGDVTDVGDCSGGACFTAGGAGNTLWFEGPTADDFEIILTAVDAVGQDYTITLPAATGYVALGTSTANYVAYWTSTSTLAGEQYLATSRGGIGESSVGWNGMVRVVGGDWGPITGTANYAAYWSDANTIGAEQYLSVSRGGTGAGSFTQYGILYGMGTGALGVTAAGDTYQILTANTGAAPQWRNIADLITVQNALTESGTSTLTIKLGGTLIEDTTITQGNYNMIFNLTGTGDFKVQDAGTDILVVSDDGKIYYKTYPLAEPGKQILRGMIPILGFDLPVQTATTSFVQISRKVNACDFPPAETGATRVYKFVIRYTDTLPTASSTNWRVSTTTGAAYSTFTLPGVDDDDLATGTVEIVEPSAPGVPCNTYPWWLEVQSLPTYPNNKIKVFQIFLAAYDQIQ